jgi:hypothetical protein
MEAEAVAIAVEMDESGWRRHLARRLLISCCEDHGLAAPELPAQVMALYQLYEVLAAKQDDAQRAYRLPLIQMVLTICRARKSRIVDDCLIWAYGEPAPIPKFGPEVLDRHTRRGKRAGRGLEHWWQEGTLLLNRETGELEHSPHLLNSYRERAIRVSTGVVSTTRKVQEIPASHVSADATGGER